MKKSKVFSYITAIGISLLITEIGSRFNDYLVQKLDYRWALLVSIFIVMIILIVGYFLIEKISEMFLELEQEGFKSEFSKVTFYIILPITSIIIVLAQASSIY
ncbi:hypothetical protein [Acinetobacter johnsonii]|uniref:hypothetical protein n=1 Tax=Acinetobacter johnsonii TaxID=40214 RepID=UPI0021686FEE|nr:hypothetical protein [Acinetobacter johnsonii]MCS3528631.1 TRAP-type C4-dicarboxylate transport system permease small subunit [Acinetobacter johnsonii]